MLNGIAPQPGVRQSQLALRAFGVVAEPAEVAVGAGLEQEDVDLMRRRRRGRRRPRGPRSGRRRGRGAARRAGPARSARRPGRDRCIRARPRSRRSAELAEARHVLPERPGDRADHGDGLDLGERGAGVGTRSAARRNRCWRSQQVAVLRLDGGAAHGAHSSSFMKFALAAVARPSGPQHRPPARRASRRPAMRATSSAASCVVRRCRRRWRAAPRARRIDGERLVRMGGLAGAGERFGDGRATPLSRAIVPGPRRSAPRPAARGPEVGRGAPAAACPWPAVPRGMAIARSRAGSPPSLRSRGRASRLGASLEGRARGAPRHRAPAGLQQQRRRQAQQPLVGPLVLEDPQAVLGAAQRLVLASVLEAELGQVQIVPGRGQVLGAQRDAGVDVAVALREEVEDARRAWSWSAGEAPLRSRGRARRQAIPGSVARRRYSARPASPSTSA